MPTLDDPVAISLGPLTVRWYALFILAGIFGAIALIRALARRRGMDPEFVLDIAPWMVVSGIVGARLTYVLLKWDRYADAPLDALNIRLGGLSIHGAVFLGALILWALCRRAGVSFLGWGDLIIAGVALGQAVGRWGNWANQEAFGTPTDVPWAVTIRPDRRPAAYTDQATFHPTFFYESVANLLNAAVLSYLVLRMPGSRRLREGDAIAVYGILYGVERFLIERIRTDSVYLGPLPGAYWASFALVAIGVAMLVLRRTVWSGGQVAPLHPRREGVGGATPRATQGA
ncbi:MAG: Prolipoprotein diacylglyceryl transferase [uncultured Thermomicrobiales bacterium]|uniref:Phosphatidylglycerol--prolipoprotein diacylglyceryl transferase n=1 Tax=uncultured Thermomicrobiales bacterium TaxID=1645740 RepID=A0A6J4VGU4_9BACT|nr:MAG: Prolipoprotein diacylglyceryl transferase [uncultured Thermomicrobiales bacterium]